MSQSSVAQKGRKYAERLQGSIPGLFFFLDPFFSFLLILLIDQQIYDFSSVHPICPQPGHLIRSFPAPPIGWLLIRLDRTWLT